MPGAAPEAVGTMPEKPARTAVPIHELIARRWSPRSFDPERPVGREALLALMEAARWAPSCYGDQPWRYLVADRFADPAGWEAVFACLAEQNRRWAGAAPLLLVACADTRFGFSGEPNRWGAYDTGAASENLCLQAVALGLAAHQMGGFDAEALRRACAIPPRFEPMAVIAVGHPAGPDRLPPDLRERETAPRERRPLGERFFRARWGEPAV